MILFTGPRYNGKKRAAERYAAGHGLSAPTILEDAETRVRNADDLAALADELSAYEILLINEIGSGLVPTDAENRAFREKAGRLSVLLADRAEEVYRVVCGIPTRLK